MQELAVNAHARSVDLRQFDKTTVRVLAEYIESKKVRVVCARVGNVVVHCG